MRLVCFVAILLFFSGFIYAHDGHDVGNGGGGVLCTSEKTETLELLDYYEARIFLKEFLPLNKGTGKDFVAVAHSLVDRIKALDPERASRYHKSVDEFQSKSVFVADMALPPTSDWGYVPLPMECKIVQIAVQRIHPGPNYPKYSLSETYWNKLSEESKAGLVLHEIIYSDAIQLGQTDSILSRYFTAFLVSKKLTNNLISSSDYLSLINRIGLGAKGFEGGPQWVQKIIPHYNSAYPTLELWDDIGNFVHHPNGLKIKIKKIAGPEWLKVSESGEIRGIPSEADLGANDFTLSATDEKGMSSQVILQVLVESTSESVHWKNTKIMVTCETYTSMKECYEKIGLTSNTTKPIEEQNILETPKHECLYGIIREPCIGTYRYNAYLQRSDVMKFDRCEIVVTIVKNPSSLHESYFKFSNYTLNLYVNKPAEVDFRKYVLQKPGQPFELFPCYPSFSSEDILPPGIWISPEGILEGVPQKPLFEPQVEGKWRFEIRMNLHSPSNKYIQDQVPITIYLDQE